MIPNQSLTFGRSLGYAIIAALVGVIMFLLVTLPGIADIRDWQTYAASVGAGALSAALRAALPWLLAFLPSGVVPPPPPPPHA